MTYLSSRLAKIKCSIKWRALPTSTRFTTKTWPARTQSFSWLNRKKFMRFRKTALRRRIRKSWSWSATSAMAFGAIKACIRSMLLISACLTSKVHSVHARRWSQFTWWPSSIAADRKTFVAVTTWHDKLLRDPSALSVFIGTHNPVRGARALAVLETKLLAQLMAGLAKFWDRATPNGML